MPPKKAAEPAVRASTRVKAIPNAVPAPKSKAASKATSKNAQQPAAPAPTTKRKTADEDSSSRSVKQTKTAPNTGRKIAPLKATVTKAAATKSTKKVVAPADTLKKATAAKATATKSTAAKSASTKRAASEASLVNSVGPTVDKRKATDEDASDRPVKKANINGAIGLKAPRPVKIPRRGAPSIINKAPIQKLNVYVCGEGSSGELGLGSARNAVDVKRPRLNPNLAADKVGVVQIATGGMHALALTHDSKILSWGVNDLGAVGRDTKWEGGLKDISDGSSDDGSDDDDGSDSGMNPKESTPMEVPSQYFEEGTKFVQVAAGDSASFAVTDEGYVYGWGTFRVRLPLQPP
jgi:regulator of chromosome condensation